VTVTENWHCEAVAIEAAPSAMLLGAVTVRLPLQTVAEPLATVSPAGSVSVKPTKVSGTGLPAGLVIVMVS
jgi:hypothetical protein